MLKRYIENQFSELFVLFFHKIFICTVPIKAIADFTGIDSNILLYRNKLASPYIVSTSL